MFELNLHKVKTLSAVWKGGTCVEVFLVFFTMYLVIAFIAIIVGQIRRVKRAKAQTAIMKKIEERLRQKKDRGDRE